MQNPILLPLEDAKADKGMDVGGGGVILITSLPLKQQEAY
jgi:hypothetical protein